MRLPSTSLFCASCSSASDRSLYPSPDYFNLHLKIVPLYFLHDHLFNTFLILHICTSMACCRDLLIKVDETNSTVE